jgi:hypothetical protein
MIWFLRILFMVIIASMLAITTWAGGQQSLSAFAHSATFRDPWVIATLFDAYWAFVTFYVWMAWKEQTLGARLLWFPPVMLLGNLAMSVYMLVQLFAVPPEGPLGDVFTRRQPGRLLLPAVLMVVAVVVYLFA